MVFDFRTNAAEIFTPLFYELQDCKTRYLLNYGGSGSSKSYSQHQLELLNLLDNPTADTLFIRKWATTLYDSCYMLLDSIARDWGVYNRFRWTYGNAKRQIQHPNGKRIIFKGLDDAEKIKSIAGIKRIIIEEASELAEADFLELMRRARGIPDIQIVLLFNPISETHWIKKMFFDSGVFELGRNLTIIKTTYLDNPFLTEEDIEQFELMKRLNYDNYRVYALGQWGVISNTRPWLYAFSYKKSVAKSPLALIPDLPVHLSFDFNINPLTCIAGQHTAGYGDGSFVHILKEYAVENAVIPELCKMIKSDFPFSVFTATGDASGRARNAGYTSGAETIWGMVQKELGLSDTQILTPSVNPSWKNSRFLCNALLQRHPNYIIDPGCTTLINDMQIAKPKDTDNPAKEDELFKQAGASAYGMHLFDTWRYYNNTHFAGFARNPFA